ncbi:hypothetical protein TanjilG_01503 [Lupinus angustifolius]|uniref:Uncharacterized protein n=1 Tax=Lupinus angustifolius TaxID=3871 RepID=A0A4P1QVG0_LUPAN|nr:PREDICTED: uncharacterized protein LOC109330346 [Lupinus angustifolius]OIV95709.1 hypothetical protein TanjilG_01503 [Lupinus angustifolius]
MAEELNANGIYVDANGSEEEQKESFKLQHRNERRTRHNIPQILNRFASAVLFPEPENSGSLINRFKISIAENAPLLPEASRNSARDVLLWTHRGSPLRAIFVISVGTTILVSLTGLLVFMLFFLAATISAIVVLLLMSLASVGGFLALFFTFVAAIYIGALSVAMLAISVTTFWATVAILITTGWIGFFYTAWLVTRKSFEFATHSLSVTGSAVSTYTVARAARYTHH